MNIDNKTKNESRSIAYLTSFGAWALAFGCAVGWGAFMMPGNTFLPLAGPIGTYIGMMLGAMVMAVLAANFHYLMNRFPDEGGTYTYTKKCLGYDHGLLSAWFLLLTYIAVAWANASAIPLVARTLLGSTFQFGFHYQIAGFDVYGGEVMLAVLALVISAVICLRRKAAEITQIAAAVLLFGGIVTCLVIAMTHTGSSKSFVPAFSPDHTPIVGVFTIFALAPWAFVGFESITHSAAEAKFNLKRSFGIMLVALITAGFAYSFLALLAVTARPEGCNNWVDYIHNLGSYEGIQSAPTFNAAYSALGDTGALILGVAALCGMLTGLLGNFIALSRLLYALADDGMISDRIAVRNRDLVPVKAIWFILCVSLIFPFLGRTAISWIVDVTTVGATIAYAFASASAWKSAKEENNGLFMGTGIAGVVVSLMFAVVFLVPNITSVQTLSTESYLILATWGILGFVAYRYILLNHDKEKHLGRSTIAWIVLLGLIIFTSSVWMLQSTDAVIARTLEEFEMHYAEDFAASGTARPMYEYLLETLQTIDKTLAVSVLIQVGLIVTSLMILFNIYSITQKRERQTEIEKALAEDASKAKTSFLSNMSHEIRTPMNAIIGLDSIALRNPNIPPQTREQLEKIGASAKHLLGLINDILDMSRIESGRMVLKDEEFSMRELLDQVNIIINGQCQDKGLHYECNIVGRVRDYYYGDNMKLKQVIINILGNSVKFTEVPGQVTLTVQEIAEEDGMCTLSFAMKDTGVGMDEEFIPKIFDAFSQEDATATNRYGGSGLGMAITKNFVAMMNGDIDVKSKKGVGSTFTVTVSLRPSDRTFRKEESARLPEGFRIAMVDDDEVSCDHGSMVLKDIGASCDKFNDPEEALSRIREAHESGSDYDLVLTDFKMPGMNGLELTKRIREFDDGKTAVIMLTGYNWDIIEDEAEMEGVDGIIAKPLFPDSLLREIHTVLMRRAGEEPAQEEQPEEVERNIAGRRVLMAEDVQQNAEILEDLLDLEDVSTEHALNGQIAVEMFSSHPAGYYDAILMDVRMPVMDGLTAAQEIRALNRPDAKDIPIIAMTANVFDEDVEKSKQAGMNAHLAKPIEPEKLYDTLSKLIAEQA